VCNLSQSATRPIRVIFHIFLSRIFLSQFLPTGKCGTEKYDPEIIEMPVNG
jgi:hypothetical protein